MSERTEFIDGLRKLADFYEANEGLQVPTCSVNADYFCKSEEEAAELLGIVGAGEKRNSQDDIIFAKKFTDKTSFNLWIKKDWTCKKVVTKKIVPATPAREALPEREVEVVTWECDDPSLLALKNRYARNEQEVNGQLYAAPSSP